jgi:hypothetical protein
MSDQRMIYRCPECDSADVPKLIVRGSGNASPGISLRCRNCGCEWSEELPDLKGVTAIPAA